MMVPVQPARRLNAHTWLRSETIEGTNVPHLQAGLMACFGDSTCTSAASTGEVEHVMHLHLACTLVLLLKLWLYLDEHLLTLHPSNSTFLVQVR